MMEDILRYDDVEAMVFGIWVNLYESVGDAVPRSVRRQSLRDLRKALRERARVKSEWRPPEWAHRENITYTAFMSLGDGVLSKAYQILDHLKALEEIAAGDTITRDLKERLEAVTQLTFDAAGDWRAFDYIRGYLQDLFPKFIEDKGVG